jgi:Ser/Thr protein kinase RdoA (MazF antagonist)
MTLAATPLSASAVTQLAAHWPGLAPTVRACTPLRLHGGEESAAYQLGPIVVRVGPSWRSAAELEWSGRVALAAAGRVPEALAPLPSASDHTVHVVDGRPVSVWPFVAGSWACRSNQSHFRAAAQLLARIHTALAAARLGPRPGPGHSLGDASDLADPDLDDWQQVFRRTHPRRQILHGDYYPGNLLADGNRLVALLDWDDSFIDAAETELAVAAWEWSGGLYGWSFSSVRDFVSTYCHAGGTATALDETAVRQLIRLRLRWEIQLKRTGRFGPASSGDNRYTGAQISAFHDLAPQ